MKNLFKKIAILSIAMLIFGCSEDGKPGEKGEPGNANVNVLADFTILPTDWQTTGNLKYVTISINGLTQNIVNSSAVMVYQKNASTGSYIALPYSYQGIDRGFAFGLNYIQITLSASSPITVTGNTIIKAVIIPSSSRMANPNVNWKNYEEVKSRFNLKD
jgi:hypothetical protein